MLPRLVLHDGGMCACVVGRSRFDGGGVLDSQEIIEEAKGLLDMVVGVSTVHAKFYDLSSGYHQVGVSVTPTFIFSHSEISS